jgi:hypothetical protein
MMPPKSTVTLSGLLNVLDSVASEEGRITFATVCLIFVRLGRNLTLNRRTILKIWTQPSYGREEWT